VGMRDLVCTWSGVAFTAKCRTGRPRPLRIFMLCLLGAGLSTPGYAAELSVEPVQPPYIFGVFPSLAVARLEKIYAPMAADLGRGLDRKVYFRTKSSFDKFMQEIKKQTYDIVFLQPFDYVWAVGYGYLPLARRGEPLTAQIMVAEDSPLRELKDLKGAILALPPAEAAVSHLIKMALLDAGMDPEHDLSLQYTKSHDSCLQRLLIGAVNACGTAAGPVRFFQARMKVSFRVLAESRTIPHALIVAHRRVPEHERDRLKSTILAWGDSVAGRQMLERGAHKPFEPAIDAEYDVVRKYWRRIGP